MYIYIFYSLSQHLVDKFQLYSIRKAKYNKKKKNTRRKEEKQSEKCLLIVHFLRRFSIFEKKFILK